jgi:large subunit ribosomal protein L1
MGKIRTRTLGLEEVEKKQKEEQKQKAAEKKKTREAQVEEKDIKVKEEKKTEKRKTEKKVVKVAPRSKKYQEAKKMVDVKKTYTISEAISLLKKMKYADFDESVEVHLNVDETGLKGEVELPHSTGKTIKIKIVDDKVLSEIESGKLDFDILITHPSFMPKLAKFARVLGPKGLMPNPKAGTISTNPEEVVKKFAKGTIRWKTEAKFPLIHQMLGKISFDEKALKENTIAFLKSVGKGHIQKAILKTTMSPGVKLDIEKV